MPRTFRHQFRVASFHLHSFSADRNLSMLMGAVHSALSPFCFFESSLPCSTLEVRSSDSTGQMAEVGLNTSAPSLDSGEDGSDGLYLPNSCTDQGYSKSTSYPRSITYSFIHHRIPTTFIHFLKAILVSFLILLPIHVGSRIHSTSAS